MICRMILTLILLTSVLAFSQERKFPALTPAERKLSAKATKLGNEGAQLLQQGKTSEALAKVRQSLEISQRLYPESKYPDGHPQLALGLANMGAVLQASATPDKAMSFMSQAVEVYRKLYPESKYPDGHPELARSLSNLSALLWKMGLYDKALPHCEQAVATYRKLYPESKYPAGDVGLADSLMTLGVVSQAMGSFEKALPCVEQAIAMYRKLYQESKHPNGHADIARGMNNLGFLYQAMGSREKALPYYRQALEMRQKLYPSSKFPGGHPELVLSVNNLAALLVAMGSYEEALPHAERAVAMMRILYSDSKFPDGHPNLVHGINNLGVVLLAMGSAEKALIQFQEADAMVNKMYPSPRYPDSHFDVANVLKSLGCCFYAMGSFDKALPCFERAAGISRKLCRQMIASVSEGEALDLVQVLPVIHDWFLSVTTRVPGTDAAAYNAVWSGKSAVTRVLEQRHAASRAIGTEHATKLDDLKALRRRIDLLLQDRRLPPAERDKLLAEAADERDMLERGLAKELPLLQRAKELDALGPDALTQLLPDHAVLIDFIRYRHLDYDRTNLQAAKQATTPSYAAFVLAKGQPIRRIELGEAEIIDHAINLWRTAIETRTFSPAIAELHKRIWVKLAPHLPVGTKTLYISPDGDLARMPWTALSISENRVLLEEFAIATVAHGPFLLESLKYLRDYKESGSTLLLGGIEYNSKKWQNLPGAATELTALTALAPSSPTSLTKSDATPKRLTELLPKARYAHIATHGYFDAEALTAEQQRAKQAMETRQFGDETRRVAAKNPLAFTGLVLADGKVLSGLNLVDLPLENLKLVTLSACETGLGDLTGGEGVQGLQRAFHLAGCPNVVASLWKVNDAATAALMAKFYHELWINKKPPIDALREAQLMVYRRPDLISDLAAERGAPNLKKAIEAKSVDLIPKEVTGKKTADTKLWAAFVLSGVGKW